MKPRHTHPDIEHWHWPQPCGASVVPWATSVDAVADPATRAARHLRRTLRERHGALSFLTFYPHWCWERGSVQEAWHSCSALRSASRSRRHALSIRTDRSRLAFNARRFRELLQELWCRRFADALLLKENGRSSTTTCRDLLEVVDGQLGITAARNHLQHRRAPPKR